MSSIQSQSSQRQIIIKQLKCLIAKQQLQINSLHSQVKSLKKYLSLSQLERYQQTSRDVVNNKQRLQQQQQPKYVNDNNSQHNNKFSQDNNQDQYFFKKNNTLQNSIQKSLQIINHQLQTFFQTTYQQFWQKYLSYQNHNHKQLQQQTNQKSKLLFNEFTNIQEFAQFFPSFLNHISQTFVSIKNQIDKYKDRQITLSKKIISQQKALQQIMAEYQKNIHQSQIIEHKLLKQISFLQKQRNYKNKGLQKQFYNNL